MAKVHYGLETPNRFGGFNYRSLCGFDNATLDESRTGQWDEVTCKHCLNRRAIHEKRERSKRERQARNG